MNKAEHYNEAGTVARGDETYGLLHPHHFCPHQIVGLRVTEVQCQLPHQCHQGLIDLEDPGITLQLTTLQGVQRPYEN